MAIKDTYYCTTLNQTNRRRIYSKILWTVKKFEDFVNILIRQFKCEKLKRYVLSLNFKTSEELTSLKADATEELLVMSPLAFIIKL